MVIVNRGSVLVVGDSGDKAEYNRERVNRRALSSPSSSEG